MLYKEITYVNIKKKWSEYRTLRYTKKNLSKRAVRGIYFASLFSSFQIQINKVQGISITFAISNSWSIQSKALERSVRRAPT